MKLQKAVLAGLLVLILLSSITIGHFFPPAGILIIPVIILMIIWLIMFTEIDCSIYLKSFFCYFFIGLNDIGIKLFAGGRHDLEGIGRIHMLFFVGLIPGFILLLMGIGRNKTSSVVIKVISILIFVLLVYSHFEMFETLGVNTE